MLRRYWRENHAYIQEYREMVIMKNVSGIGQYRKFSMTFSPPKGAYGKFAITNYGINSAICGVYDFV